MPLYLIHYFTKVPVWARQIIEAKDEDAAKLIAENRANQGSEFIASGPDRKTLVTFFGQVEYLNTWSFEEDEMPGDTLVQVNEVQEVVEVGHATKTGAKSDITHREFKLA